MCNDRRSAYNDPSPFQVTRIDLCGERHARTRGSSARRDRLFTERTELLATGHRIDYRSEALNRAQVANACASAISAGGCQV